MVRIVDEGSQFDAPVDVVWKYMMDGDAHAKVHKTTRTTGFTPVTESTFVWSGDRESKGTWEKESIRMTALNPIALTHEWIEGPLKGSKAIHLYTPKGEKTQIDVYGEFTSSTIPPDHLERYVRELLAGDFSEDAPAIREYARRK
ncbi:MAG: hypothetical protein L3K13_02950 [Thermoplasmata archaeon]|nr:hypothetical protein [Thermoplasmata archaeon]